MWHRLITALILLSGLAGGCAEPVGPEALIRANIMAMETALAEHSPLDFLEHLSESFTGGRAGRENMDRDAASKMLGLYFLRYRNIEILLSQVNVEIDSLEPGLAYSSANVALAGGERLIPNSAGLYRVSGQWQNFDGDWKLIRLEWE